MSTFLQSFFVQEKEIYVTEFGHTEIENPKTIGPWSREQYILHYVAKGYCDFSGFRAEAGSLFLISKELYHSFTTSDKYEHYWIGFGGSHVETLFSVFNLRFKPHQLFYVDNIKFIDDIFSDVLRNVENRTEGTEDIVLSALMAIFPMLRTVKSAEATHRLNYAEKVQKYIRSNYVHNIKMEKIAEEIHITEKHMYRLFLKRFGMSPQKYLLKTRMQKAKELLEDTTLSIKEVASSVGYTSVPSFSSAYSKYFSSSPLEYRNLHFNK